MSQSAAQQLQQTQKELRALSAATDKAAAMALNKGASQARTLAGRLIRENLKLKTGYLNENIRVIQRAKPSDLTAIIAARKRGMLMSNYPYREMNKGGVSVQIKATGGRMLLKSAFTMQFTNGSVGIMVREKSAAGGKAKSHGLATLYSPSASQALNTIKDDVLQDAGEKVVAEFERLKAWQAKK